MIILPYNYDLGECRGKKWGRKLLQHRFSCLPLCAFPEVQKDFTTGFLTTNGSETTSRITGRVMGFGYSCIFLLNHIVGRIILVLVAVGISSHILRLPTLRSPKQ